MSCKNQGAPAQLLAHSDVLNDLRSPLIASPTHKRYPGAATPFHVSLPLDPLTRAESYDTVSVSGKKRGSSRGRVDRLTIGVEALRASAE
jgi:hypothetical protein